MDLEKYVGMQITDAGENWIRVEDGTSLTFLSVDVC
jgi:hypothetical protein